MLKKNDPIGNVLYGFIVVLSVFIAFFAFLAIIYMVINSNFPEQEIGASHLLMGPILGAAFTFFFLWLLDHIKRAYERKLTTVKLLRGLLAEVSMNGFIASGKFVTEPTSEILSPRVFQIDFWKNNAGSFYFLDETESIAKTYVYFYYSNQMESDNSFLSDLALLKKRREFIDGQIEDHISPAIKEAIRDIKAYINGYMEKSIWYFLLNKDFKSAKESRKGSSEDTFPPDSQ